MGRCVMTHRNGDDIRQRAFQFACDIVRLAMHIAPRPGLRSIIDQVVRAGTSIGANLEEAKAASTRREFTRGLEIALREAREAHYWLRICLTVNLISGPELRILEREADQLVRILTAVVLSTKRRTLAGLALVVVGILNAVAVVAS